jgi:hypothetical protein
MISNAAKSAGSISEIRTGIATEIRALARGQGSVSQTHIPLAFILAISREPALSHWNMIPNSAKSAELISEISTVIAQEIRVLARGQCSVSQTMLRYFLAFILVISRDLTRLVSLEDDFRY